MAIKYESKGEMDKLCCNKKYKFLSTERYATAKALFK